MGPRAASEDDPSLLIHGNQVNMDALWLSVQRLTDSYAQALGLAFIILGTVLAGYGDVLFEALWPLTGRCGG